MRFQRFVALSCIAWPIPVMLTGCAIGMSPATTTTSRVGGSGCALTEDQKRSSATLSFGDFDQAGTTPSTGRALSNRGCFAAAAEAREDYLARVTLDSERSQTSVIFHIAQDLAMTGDHARAATVLLGAKRVSQPADAAFDWNTYVVGTWAFLKRDRALLEDRFQHLKALPGHGNQTNAKVLDGLIRCFDEPYLQAYGPKCRPG